MDKLLTFALCIAVIFMLIGLMPVHGEEAIYDEVIRLHVIANSDTAEDQAQKLAVRDAVLAYTESILSAANSREEAIDVLKEHSDEIQAVAIEALRKCGSSDGVYVELGTETYPTREYAACAFPSGDYL
ncbi:MAG: stage II sporulation protein R, partial [Clostridia bacterium]|nr:stage II sporulation protein R [Clostridia bacterium]